MPSLKTLVSRQTFDPHSLTLSAFFREIEVSHMVRMLPGPYRYTVAVLIPCYAAWTPSSAASWRSSANNLIRFSSSRNVWRKAFLRSIALPSTVAGSVIRQCALTVLYGHAFQTSPSGRSHTLITKSRRGAVGPRNSVQGLLRNRSHEKS